MEYKLLNEDGENGILPSKSVTANYQDNQITHKEIFPSVTLRSIIFDDSVKEDLILDKYTGHNIFSYHINTDLDDKKEDDGSITFSDKQGKLIYNFL